jgi:hypothetical protein
MKNIVIKSQLEIKLLIPNTENKTINGCSASKRNWDSRGYEGVPSEE